MVAVSTTTRTRPAPALRSPGRHLALVPRPSAGTGSQGGRSPSPAVLRPGRVYRRRRVAAALFVAGSAFVAWAALGALGGVLTVSGRSAPRLGTPVSAQVVEVAPGDTFWSIALRLQPEGDVRPLVDRLVRAHGGSVLHAGEKIALPSPA